MSNLRIGCICVGTAMFILGLASLFLPVYPNAFVAPYIASVISGSLIGFGLGLMVYSDD